MAYTKAPAISTNSSERIDFVYNSQARSADTPEVDSRFLNVMVENLPSPIGQNSRAVIKSRPGMSSLYTLSGGIGRALYYWVFSNVSYIVAVCGDKVSINGTILQTLTTTTGAVGFVEHVDDLGVVTLFMCDGDKGYVFTNPTLAPTLITDVNFPSPHVPMPIFMDGYIFVAKSNSQDIYNSELNVLTSWTQTGSPMYISAEMYPDTVQGLAKNNNYIYAIGRGSIEYFYDSANAVGSPLAREASAVLQFGTIAPRTIIQTSKEVILVGETGNAGHTVWTIDGFKEKEISTSAIRSILLKEGTLLPEAVGSVVRVSSQKLYILKLTTRTLVYSFDTELWSEWASGTDNNSNFFGTLLCDGPGGAALALLSSGVTVAEMNEDTFLDVDQAIYCQVVTPKYDFGTINRKTMSRLALVGDVPDSTGVDNTFTIYWTDDDYKTWSAGRSLTFNYDFPVISQLGNFRRRAFKIVYNAPHLVRLDEIEVDINKGSS